jgi:hypothetical protein
MKILHLQANGDYDAVVFASQNEGKKVSDIIKIIESGETIQNNEDDYDFELSVVEVGEVDERFLNFIRKNQDYDESKHSNFWLENELLYT